MTTEQVPIRTIAALTGVNPITLRAWERRYGLVRPLRSPAGHRLYTHQHVERIRRVLECVARGVPIGRVRAVLDAEPKVAVTEGAHGPWRHYLDRMIAAIARFDELELDRVYEDALSIHAIDEVTALIVLPLLHELGNRWAGSVGSVAEEHFFSVHLRTKLGARLLHRMRHASGPRIVAACAPGEQHEIGLLLFALEAQRLGLRTILLGADTPLDDIGIAQQRSKSDAVVIASHVDPAPEFLESGLPKLVRRLAVPVFVGGATASRRRRAIRAAGATPLGVALDDGARLVKSALPGQPPA